MFSAETYDPVAFTKAYERHDTRVRQYLAARTADLLIVDVCTEEPAWEPIFRFLGKPVPAVRFPWGNRTGATEALLLRLLNVFGDPQRTAAIASVYPG